MQYTSSIWWQTFNVLRKLVWLLTCVSISSILCRVSRSSAWASASRNLTLINSSCISLSAFFLGLSFQRPAVRAKWRWGRGVTVSHLSATFCTLKKMSNKDNVLITLSCVLTCAHLPVLFQVSDLLPQLFEAGQSLRLSQLHTYQLLLKTRHVGVIW